MYCNNCGERNIKTAIFCKRCGNKLSDEDKPSVSKKSKNESALVLIEIALWLGAAIVLYNLFLPGSKFALWQILINELIIIGSIAFIKGWHKQFGLISAGIFIMILANISVWSVVDIILYLIALTGVYLKNKYSSS